MRAHCTRRRYAFSSLFSPSPLPLAITGRLLAFSFRSFKSGETAATPNSIDDSTRDYRSFFAFFFFSFYRRRDVVRITLHSASLDFTLTFSPIVRSAKTEDPNAVRESSRQCFPFEFMFPRKFGAVGQKTSRRTYWFETFITKGVAETLRYGSGAGLNSSGFRFSRLRPRREEKDILRHRSNRRDSGAPLSRFLISSQQHLNIATCMRAFREI